MRARIETKAAKAGALRGRSDRKRRDRAQKAPRIRSERRSPESRTLPYLPNGVRNVTRAFRASGPGTARGPRRTTGGETRTVKPGNV